MHTATVRGAVATAILKAGQRQPGTRIAGPEGPAI
jgi:hypothetical protein